MEPTLWTRTERARRILSSVLFVLGLFLLGLGEDGSTALAGLMLGISFVAVRGAPWVTEPKAASPTSRPVATALLIVALIFGGLVLSKLAAVQDVLSDVEGSVSSIEGQIG